MHFRRKAVLTVPGFTVEGYRHQLSLMQAEGSFVAHAERFLIEVRKPQ
jgi:hypothetical protein